jgi:hypothetical protein
MTSPSVIVHLLGPAGVGKLTVARELSVLLPGKVVDNHWINNPILGLLDNDRMTPFPVEAWQQTSRVRSAVLDTIAMIASRRANFILTNELYADEPDAADIVMQVRRCAELRDAIYVPVRLSCDASHLAARIVSEDRAARLKSMDAFAAERNAIRDILKTGSPFELTLDTSDATARSTADVIIGHFRRIRVDMVES